MFGFHSAVSARVFLGILEIKHKIHKQKAKASQEIDLSLEKPSKVKMTRLAAMDETGRSRSP